jgi:hypothetical protein
MSQVIDLCDDSSDDNGEWQNNASVARKKKSQVIDLCDDSDSDSDSDNGDYPNNASVPPLPLSRKTHCDTEESSNDTYFRNESSCSGNKYAAGSAEFVFDLELADEMEVISPPKKRRDSVKSKRSAKSDAAGSCAQILEGVHVTERDVGSEDAQVTDHRESHQCLTAAASHPMNAYSKLTSRDDGSKNQRSPPHNTKRFGVVRSERNVKHDAARKCAQIRKGVHTTDKDVDSEDSEHISLDDGTATKLSKKVSTSKPPSNASGQQLRVTTREVRLCELAEYRHIHGHCNVPMGYSKNSKLGRWVSMQRRNYWLYMEGKRSAAMTIFRVQELERIGFEWKPSLISGKPKPKKPSLDDDDDEWKPSLIGVKGKPKKPSLNDDDDEWKPSLIGGERKRTLDDDATRVREMAVEAPEHVLLHRVAAVENSVAIKSTSLSNRKNSTGTAKATSTSSRVESANRKRVESGAARFDETDLDSSPSELAAKPSLYSKRQATKSLSPDKAAPAGDSEESNTRKDSLHAKLPWPAHQQKSIASFSRALFVVAPSENASLVAAKKPTNSRQEADSQLERAPSNERLRASPVAVEPLQQMRYIFTQALLLGDCSTGNCVQTTPDKQANSSQDTQQTSHVEDLQSDNVLNEVELELVWLGEESMYCLSRPVFQFDFIYEYASPALKVELRKLSRDAQNETEILKQLVRMEDRLVYRRFDFIRNDIRMMLGRGFRRQRMRIVIAELRLLQRQQLKRHFPATILERSETAIVKASTVIEQVDFNTLKVVATFPSQIEAEQETGVPRANISRGMRQGRPVGGYFWRSVRLQSF